MNEMDHIQTSVGRSAAKSVAAATLTEHVDVDFKSAMEHTASWSADFGTRETSGDDGEYFSTVVGLACGIASGVGRPSPKNHLYTRTHFLALPQAGGSKTLKLRGLKHSSSTPILRPVDPFRPTSPVSKQTKALLESDTSAFTGDLQMERAAHGASSGHFQISYFCYTSHFSPTHLVLVGSSPSSEEGSGKKITGKIGARSSFMSSASSMEREVASASSRSLRRRSAASARRALHRGHSNMSRSGLSERTLSSQSMKHLTTISLFEALEKIVYVHLLVCFPAALFCYKLRHAKLWRLSSDDTHPSRSFSIHTACSTLASRKREKNKPRPEQRQGR